MSDQALSSFIFHLSFSLLCSFISYSHEATNYNLYKWLHGSYFCRWHMNWPQDLSYLFAYSPTRNATWIISRLNDIIATLRSAIILGFLPHINSFPHDLVRILLRHRFNTNSSIIFTMAGFRGFTKAVKKYTLLSLWMCGQVVYFVIYVCAMVVIVCSVVALCVPLSIVLS